MTATSALPLFIRSLSRDPLFNLSLEHALLRHSAGHEHIGLMYRNEACVVIGRNQNPWSELDVIAMRSLGLKMVRRRSGGGAVYHDDGNTNYCFHTSKEQFKRRFHADLVTRALNQQPIGLQAATTSHLRERELGAYVNDRNDICVALPDYTGRRIVYKVSGSAYKLTAKRAYHHGTMLLNSNLDNLGTVLKPSREAIISKGVQSVSSAVINLTKAFPFRRESLTHDIFCSSVQREFEAIYGRAKVVTIDKTDVSIAQLPSILIDEIRNSQMEMKSWSWNWGQTPAFTQRLRQTQEIRINERHPPIPAFEIEISVRDGIIVTCEVSKGDLLKDDDVNRFLSSLISRPYDAYACRPDVFGQIEGNREAAHATRPVPIGQTDSRYPLVAVELTVWLESVM